MSFLHGKGSLEGFSIGAVVEAQCKVTAHALVPLNLQTDVWAPAAATKDKDER